MPALAGFMSGVPFMVNRSKAAQALSTRPEKGATFSELAKAAK